MSARDNDLSMPAQAVQSQVCNGLFLLQVTVGAITLHAIDFFKHVKNPRPYDAVRLYLDATTSVKTSRHKRSTCEVLYSQVNQCGTEFNMQQHCGIN
jgi:hypothetical protein